MTATEGDYVALPAIDRAWRVNVGRVGTWLHDTARRGQGKKLREVLIRVRSAKAALEDIERQLLEAGA